MSIAYVPISTADLAELLAGTRVAGPVPVVTVTPQLRETFGLEPDAEEVGERTALQLASIQALLNFHRRLVLVVDEPLAPDPPDDLGAAAIASLDWSMVTAVFADGPDTDTQPAALAAAGMSLADAWDVAEVQQLLSDHELMWFGPDEADSLLAQHPSA